MQLPQRRAQALKVADDGPVALTAAAVKRLEQDIESLERQQPQAIEDVSVAVQKGDLSENAEYQEARARLSRIQQRLFSLKDRLKRVVLIEHPAAGATTVSLGSTVVVDGHGIHKTYFIVGPHESNPSRGRISHLSPLGSALLNHSVGDEINFQTPNGNVSYRILQIS